MDRGACGHPHWGPASAPELCRRLLTKSPVWGFVESGGHPCAPLMRIFKPSVLHQHRAQLVHCKTVTSRGYLHDESALRGILIFKCALLDHYSPARKSLRVVNRGNTDPDRRNLTAAVWARNTNFRNNPLAVLSLLFKLQALPGSPSSAAQRRAVEHSDGVHVETL